MKYHGLEEDVVSGGWFGGGGGGCLTTVGFSFSLSPHVWPYQLLRDGQSTENLSLVPVPGLCLKKK